MGAEYFSDVTDTDRESVLMTANNLDYVVRATGDEVWLKDPESRHDWGYDIRLVFQGDGRLCLEIAFVSNAAKRDILNLIARFPSLDFRDDDGDLLEL